MTSGEKIGDVINHMKNNHAETDLYSKCQICDFKTQRKSHLKEHNETVHFKTIKNCDQCEYSVSMLHNLAKHKQEKHEGGISLQYLPV